MFRPKSRRHVRYHTLHPSHHAAGITVCLVLSLLVGHSGNSACSLPSRYAHSAIALCAGIVFNSNIMTASHTETSVLPRQETCESINDSLLTSSPAFLTPENSAKSNSLGLIHHYGTCFQDPHPLIPAFSTDQTERNPRPLSSGTSPRSLQASRTVTRNMTLHCRQR